MRCHGNERGRALAAIEHVHNRDPGRLYLDSFIAALALDPFTARIVGVVEACVCIGEPLRAGGDVQLAPSWGTPWQVSIELCNTRKTPLKIRHLA